MNAAMDRLLALCGRVVAASVPGLEDDAALALSSCCDALEKVLLKAPLPRAEEAAPPHPHLPPHRQLPQHPQSPPHPQLPLQSETACIPLPRAMSPTAPASVVCPGESPFRQEPRAEPSDEVQQHLVFLVHGIGQNDDFKDDDQLISWDGSAGTNGSSHEFKNSLASVLGAGMRNAPIALSVRTIEWHSRVHEEGAPGVDALLDACSPEGVVDLRAFTKGQVIDVLHYASAAHGQRVISAVSEQLHSKYQRFLRERPGWRGRVSLVGHSLGSVISLDLVTHAGHTFQGIHFPSLPLRVSNLFLLGSPAALFLVARRQEERTLQCDHLFNIVSASDPISHFLAPLATMPSGDAGGGGTGTVTRGGGGGGGGGGVRLGAAVEGRTTRRAADAMHFLPSSRELVDGASVDELARFVRAVDARGACDVLVPSKPTSKLYEIINARAAHNQFWSNADVATFVLAQLLAPWAQAREEDPLEHLNSLILRSRAAPAASALVQPTAVAPPPVSPGWSSRRDDGEPAGSSRLLAPSPLIGEPLQAASMLEVRSEVTGASITGGAMLALMQHDWLFLLPGGEARLPSLRGQIDLRGATISMWSEGSQSASYFSSTASNARTFTLTAIKYGPHGAEVERGAFELSAPSAETANEWVHILRREAAASASCDSGRQMAAEIDGRPLYTIGESSKEDGSDVSRPSSGHGGSSASVPAASAATLIPNASASAGGLVGAAAAGATYRHVDGWLPPRLSYHGAIHSGVLQKKVRGSLNLPPCTALFIA